jgi:hypothetical protein
MPRWANAEALGLALLAIGVAILAALIVRQYLRNRVTPEEHERRRRHALDRSGKIGDGEVIEVDGDSLVYTWQVSGVVYTGTQDASALRARLPEERLSMFGPVSVKFDPRNPFNSVVITEEWSGLRLK